MKPNKEALDLLAQHYRSYDMLAAEAHKQKSVEGVSKYFSLMNDISNEYGSMTNLITHGDVHKAIYLLN